MMNLWEDLRKQARKYENNIDQKLMAFSRLAFESMKSNGNLNEPDPFLTIEITFETASKEIERLLMNLAEVNEKMCEISAGKLDDTNTSDTTTLYTLKRHKEILHDYTQEFNKIKKNFKMAQGVTNTLSSVNISRRLDLYAEELKYIHNSDKLLDNQINIAIETHENLISQHLSLKRVQKHINNLSSHFPVVNSLVERINMKRKKNSIILGCVISTCTLILLCYIN